MPAIIAMAPLIFQLFDFITNQLALLHAKGEITDAQLSEIKQRAKVSDDRFDAAMAAAKARIAAGGGG